MLEQFLAFYCYIVTMIPVSTVVVFITACKQHVTTEISLF